MIRKPEGRRGASSAKEASIGAKTSSAHVPTAFSSTPLQSCAFEKQGSFKHWGSRKCSIQ